MKPQTAIKKIDRKLNEIIHEDIPVLGKVKKFVISSGGKRIRPLTHFYIARMLGYTKSQWEDVGAIGELIHAASLLHDDVIDDAATRRGKTTIHKTYDDKTAILSGDYLLACGLDHLATLEKSQELLPVFTRVVRKLSTGELIQMQHEGKLTLTSKIYHEIMLSKTGVLFGAMTEAAAILAECESDEQKTLGEFGEMMGILFQQRDDFLDYFSIDEGKPPFQDFRRGLMTYPLIILRELLPAKKRKELDRIWLDQEQRNSNTGLEKISNLFFEYEVQQELKQRINSTVHELIDFVQCYPHTESANLVISQLEKLRV